MAYHPDIPTPTGVVQDELAQMRENFQHIAPLAQAVNELQTVSGLAPITDDLQAVSGLAPYVQAILDSRIVEHNLDVATPANGLYARWDSGLQICWHTVSLDRLVDSNRALEASWTLPASFSSSSRRFAGVTWVRSASNLTPPVHEIGVPHVWNVTAGTVTSIRTYATGANLFAAGDVMVVQAFVIGRWK